MKLINMLKENNLDKYITEDVKSLKLDSYKNNEEHFIITLGKNTFKVFAHNYWLINNGKISWCYTVEKNGEETKKFPKVIAWIGTALVYRQQELIPEVE